MKKNWYSFVTIFISFLCISFASCGSDDDGDENEDKLPAITIAELESQPSFVYSSSSYETYISFKNGVMTLWENKYTSKYDTYRTYKYTIDGKKLSLVQINSSDKTIYQGYIVKFPKNDGRYQLAIVQGLDGTNIGNLPKEVVHYYEYSSFDLNF